jgi:hypothetical protein
MMRGDILLISCTCSVFFEERRINACVLLRRQPSQNFLLHTGMFTTSCMSSVLVTHLILLLLPVPHLLLHPFLPAPARVTQQAAARPSRPPPNALLDILPMFFPLPYPSVRFVILRDLLKCCASASPQPAMAVAGHGHGHGRPRLKPMANKNPTKNTKSAFRPQTSGNSALFKDLSPSAICR